MSIIRKQLKAQSKDERERKKRMAGALDGKVKPEGPVPALEVAASQNRCLKKRDKKEARALAAQVKQHQTLYKSDERVLLVGEGNFSFARALCRHLGSLGSVAGVYATALDTDSALKRKYPDADECRREIEDLGATALVGVDATRLHGVREFRKAFRKIVWNFPHSGSGEKDVEKSVVEHRKLLGCFFASAARCLDPAFDSAVHIALKGGEPYKSWKVVQLVQATCPELEFQTAIPFSIPAWPGYAHRRTVGFDERFSKSDSEEVSKGSKVYVFVKRKAAAGEGSHG